MLVLLILCSARGVSAHLTLLVLTVVTSSSSVDGVVWGGVLSGGGSIGGGLSLATSSSVKPSGARGPAGMMFLVKLVVASLTWSSAGSMQVARSSLPSIDCCNLLIEDKRISSVEAPGNLNLAGKKSH